MGKDQNNKCVFLVAKVVVTHNSKVLLMRRRGTDPDRPFTWDIPGGVVEIGEDPNDAVIRETKEEVGVSLTDIKIIKVHHEYKEHYDEFVVTLVYRAAAANDEVRLSPDHDKYEWVTIEDSNNYEMPSKYHEAINLLR